jgi:hypothetical protein
MILTKIYSKPQQPECKQSSSYSISISFQKIIALKIPPGGGWVTDGSRTVVCLDLFKDNIYIIIGDQVFNKPVGITVGTIYVLFLVDAFLFSYE